MALTDFVGLGALAAMGTFALLVSLAVYIYVGIAVMAIAKKTNTPNGWFAFVPILNVYLMTQIAGLPAWYTLAILLPIIPFIGGLAMLVAIVYFWWLIAEKINYPGWYSILLMVPLVNLVVVGIMAWK